MKLDRPWFVVACAFFAMWFSGQPTLAYELRGWGYDGASQASNPPSGSDFVAIAAGDEQGVALRSDGSVVSWGQNASGQATVPPTLGTCIAVGAGGDRSNSLNKSTSLSMPIAKPTAGVALPPSCSTNPS